MGFVAKAHGIRGEVIVHLITDRTERVEPGAVLHSKRGALTVVSSRPHQRDWIVLFEGIPDRTEAETMRGLKLLAPPLDDPDALWVHELVGATVLDTAGATLGVVAAIEANPASDLLVLQGGGLIPLNFLVSQGDGQVVVDPPAGLLDL